MFKLKFLSTVGARCITQNQIHQIRGLHCTRVLGAIDKKEKPDDINYDTDQYGYTTKKFDFFKQVNQTHKKLRRVDLSGTPSKYAPVRQQNSNTSRRQHVSRHKPSEFAPGELDDIFAAERWKSRRTVNKLDKTMERRPPNVKLDKYNGRWDNIENGVKRRSNKDDLKVQSDKRWNDIDTKVKGQRNPPKSIHKSNDSLKMKNQPTKTQTVSDLNKASEGVTNSRFPPKADLSSDLQTASDESLFAIEQHALSDQVARDESILKAEARDKSFPKAEVRDEWTAVECDEVAASEWADVDREEGAESWADTFGSLNEDYEKPLDHVSALAEEAEVEYNEDSEKPHIRLRDRYIHKGEYYTANHFAVKISKLGERGMIYEAIQVLEKEMLEEKRVQPNEYVFSTLIGVLARAGYTSKAFEVFRKMSEFDLFAKSAYTALFNACANHPDKAEGLKMAHKLRQKLMLDERVGNGHPKIYAAMIKAFGVCGDTEMSFAMVDEYENTEMGSVQYIYTN